MRLLQGLALGLVGMLWAGIAFGVATPRVALVIGNAAYASSPLSNPVNDARAMSAKLRKLGFEVIEKRDLKVTEIPSTLREFRSRLQPGTEAVFFYAGHGLQVKGVNYLPAVDADIHAEEEVPYHSINVDQVLGIMEEQKTRVNLIFLDACRNNPFSRRFRSGGTGLAKVNAPSGTLISFATRPGSVAADGSGKNGLYTEHLLLAMDRPEKIEEVLKQAASGVKKVSKGTQEPWSEGMIEGDFYFVFQGPTTVNVQPVVPAANRIKSEAEREEELWDSIKDAENSEVFNEYIKSYPKGRYVTQAKILLVKLKNRPVPAVPAAAEEEAKRLEYYKDATTGMEFVRAQGGCYQMGNGFGDGGADEKPLHEVCIGDVYLGKHEVTVGQFRSFVNETGYRTDAEQGDGCYAYKGGRWQKNAANWLQPGFVQQDQHPVVCVSWNDSKAFAGWLGRKNGKQYRLLTEAEWEYAARSGGKQMQYGTSSGELSRQLANYGKEPFGPDASDGHEYTAPVGSYPANGLGLYDMTGNVWEWVSDWYSDKYYKESPRDNPQGPSAGAGRILRGGSWNNLPGGLRAADRHWFVPGRRFIGLGFRLAFPPDQ